MSYSTFWEPPTKNFRERETGWVNSSFYSHDSFCGCGNFALHLLCTVYSITRSSTPEAIAGIISTALQPKKCLTFGDTQPGDAATPEPGDAAGDLLENLQEGELEDLFREEEITTPTENANAG